MITAIIQARLGSTRLPRKVLLPLPTGQTVLERVVSQIDIACIVATPDREVLAECDRFGAKCLLWPGDENDVLTRYYAAAIAMDASIIVRITADCPLLERDAVRHALVRFVDTDADYFYNNADGSDVEVFDMEALEKAWRFSKEREHVTTYIKEHAKNAVYETYRFTGCSLDTLEDYRKIQFILGG